MKIYIHLVSSKEEAEKEIKKFSFSAKSSIEMGYPDPKKYGGFIFKSKNSYIAQTGGGIIYGFIDRAVGGSVQSCAILGFVREGTLTKSLDASKYWYYTPALNNIIKAIETLSSNIVSATHFWSDGHLKAPSVLDDRLV